MITFVGKMKLCWEKTAIIRFCNIRANVGVDKVKKS